MVGLIMAAQKKSRGTSEYMKRKDIHERVGVLEEKVEHLATREWVLGLLWKSALAVGAFGIFVLWKLFG